MRRILKYRIGLSLYEDYEMDLLTAYDEQSDDSEDKDSWEEEKKEDYDHQSNDATGGSVVKLPIIEIAQSSQELSENGNGNFFGFDRSEDSEDYNYCEHVIYGGVSAPELNVDTMISAYQLSDVPSGPDLVLNSKIDGVCPPPPKKRRDEFGLVSATNQADNDSVLNQSALIGRTSTTVDEVNAASLECTISNSLISSRSSVINRAYIFLPEPRAIKSRDLSSCSKLPRRPKRRLVGHKCVNTLQWGSVESECTHLLLSSSMDGYVRIWNAISGLCVWNRSLSQPDAAGTAAVRCARWSYGGRSVATGGYDKMARIVDVETESELFVAAHPNHVTCLRFHPSNHHLLVCGNYGRIDCWDTRSPAEQSLVRSYRGDFCEVQDLEFLPGGSEMVTCTNMVTKDSANRTIMAWDFLAGAVLSNQIYNERYHCTSLRIHPWQKHFLAQSNGNYIAIFSVLRPYRIDKKKRFEGHKVDGYWVGIGNSADGRFVYSGSSEGRLHAYDFRTSMTVGRWRVSESPCLAVECHPLLDSTVAISDMKGDVHIWE